MNGLAVRYLPGSVHIFAKEKWSVLNSHRPLGGSSLTHRRNGFRGPVAQRLHSGGEPCMLNLKQPDPDEVVEKTNDDLNAPLLPALPDSDETGFRPLTEEEKKDFVSSLDAKGRQILADLDALPKQD